MCWEQGRNKNAIGEWNKKEAIRMGSLFLYDNCMGNKSISYKKASPKSSFWQIGMQNQLSTFFMVNNRRNSDDLGLFYKDFLLKTQKNTHFAKISSKKFAYIKNKQYFCNRFPNPR